MKIHADSGKGWEYRLVDADTGVEIEDAEWADTETGEYSQLVRDDDGGLLIDETPDGPRPRYQVRRGNIRLERIA